MLSRFNHLTRHLSRQLPNYAYTPAFSLQGAFRGGRMASSIEEESKSLIHTAGCIIIGDEVLGGKVCRSVAKSKIEFFSEQG